jgi:hypothetical protein
MLKMYVYCEIVSYVDGIYISTQISESGGTSSLSAQGDRLASRNGDLLDNLITHQVRKELARMREYRSG